MFNIDNEFDNEFKIGDRIECIDASQTRMGGFWCSLILGRIYTIRGVYGKHVCLDDGGGWVKERFKHVRNR